MGSHALVWSSEILAGLYAGQVRSSILKERKSTSSAIHNLWMVPTFRAVYLTLNTVLIGSIFHDCMFGQSPEMLGHRGPPCAICGAIHKQYNARKVDFRIFKMGLFRCFLTLIKWDCALRFSTIYTVSSTLAIASSALLTPKTHDFHLYSSIAQWVFTSVIKWCTYHLLRFTLVCACAVRV